jgi:hypothetical protein
MFPFSYTGLRLVHDEKVRDAMERARIDVEFTRNSQRTARLSLLSRVFMRFPSRLNFFTRVEHQNCCFPLGQPASPPEEI